MYVIDESHLILGYFWFNLGWISISFVSHPKGTKEIENQPSFKNILAWNGIWPVHVKNALPQEFK